MTSASPGPRSLSARLRHALVGPASPLLTDLALCCVRIVLAWIFIYYGGGKLFGWFHGPGIHATSLFMSQSAHLRPGGFFAVLGGVTELGGGCALAVGVASRFAALALLADQVMAMITVTWVNGINSLSNHPGYEFNMTLAALAVVVIALGAGRLSADFALDRRLGLGPATTS